MPPANPNPDANHPNHPSTSLPLPQAHALLSSFASFLTVAIHNTLYYRGLYPRTTFLSARAFNLPVHQNRHPAVCTWVRDAVDAVAGQLAGGGVSRVGIVLHAPLESNRGGGGSGGGYHGDVGSSGESNESSSLPPGAVLERWMFDVSHFPAWPGGARAMRDYGNVLRRAAGREEDNGGEAEGGDLGLGLGLGAGAGTGLESRDGLGVNWADVDEQFRGAVRRLAHTAEKMTPLPEGCSFTVAVELKEEGEAPIGHPQAWIPSEPNLQPASQARAGSEPGSDLGGAKTTPVRSVGAGPLFFECWVEEGKVKEALRATQGSQSQ